MKVDIHVHYVPPRLLDRLQRDSSLYSVRLEEAAAGGRCLCFDGGPAIRPFFPGLLDLEKRWEEMARQGLDRQVLSVWSDVFGYGLPREKGARWHRLINQCLFQVVEQHPQRLSAMASVPLQDADMAAKELEHCVKQYGAAGGVIAANVDGVNLGDLPLDSFWAAAQELGVPLFMHPVEPVPPPRAAKHNFNPMVHYLYDTTITVASLIFNGVLDRFPSLELVLAHGGGYFPYQVGRFDRVYRNLEAPAVPAMPPSAYLRRFYYDTILHHPSPLRYLKELVGCDRLLLGTDYPVPPSDRAPLQGFREAGFSSAEVDLVGGDNARRLFRLG
jgi:aminocarboxymuconate-semialdehyde decarboxylase